MSQHPDLGEMLTRRLEEMGMSKAEFGRRINTSRQNVSLILKKKSLDTEMLWQIGKILGIDYFALLSYRFDTTDFVELPESYGKLEVKVEMQDGRLARLLEGMFRYFGERESGNSAV